MRGKRSLPNLQSGTQEYYAGHAQLAQIQIRNPKVLCGQAQLAESPIGTQDIIRAKGNIAEEWTFNLSIAFCILLNSFMSLYQLTGPVTTDATLYNTFSEFITIHV